MANKQDTTPRASLQAILQQDEDWGGYEVVDTGGVRGAAFGGALSVRDPGRALREGARGRDEPVAGGAGGAGGGRGGPPPGAGGGIGQPREPLELAGVPAGAQAARSKWRRIRGFRRSRGAAAGGASRRFSRRRSGSAATCISCATRWITCRASGTSTAGRSCAGCTTAATKPRRAGTWLLGWSAGRAATRR